MNDLYLLYSGFALLTTASLMAIWMDHVNPTEDSFKNFFLRFFYTETKTGILQRIVLGIGAILCAVYFASTTLSYYLFELFIIFTMVGITSSLFKNFDPNKDKTAKPSLSIIGKIHLVLISIGICGAVYAYWHHDNGAERSDFDNAMDVIAHLVTFSVSVSALLGETASGGKLTKQGRALIVLIIIFSSISILTSLNTSEKQGQLNKAILATQNKAKDLGETLDNLKSLSSGIKSDLSGMEESVQTKIIAAIEPVRSVLDIHLGAVTNPNRGAMAKLNSLAIQLNTRDTSFTSSVNKITNAQKALKHNEEFIELNNKALTNFITGYTATLKQYGDIVTVQNAQIQHTIQAIGVADSNFKDLMSKYEALKKNNEALNEQIQLSKSIEELITKTGPKADSIKVSEVRSLMKKY